MFDRLKNMANFSRLNITNYHDKTVSEIQQVFDKLKTWAKGLYSSNKLGLLFIYYLGHGVTDGNITNIVDQNGEFFPLPLEINCNDDSYPRGKGISLETNVMVILMMDCCRVFNLKSNSNRFAVDGENYIFYAEKSGDAAKTPGTTELLSVFTDKFFKKWDEEGHVMFPTIMDGISPERQMTTRYYCCSFFLVDC